MVWRSTDLRPGTPDVYYAQGLERRDELLGDAAGEPNRWDELVAIAQELDQIAISVRNSAGKFDQGYVDWTVLQHPAFDIAYYLTDPYPPEDLGEYGEYATMHEHAVALTRLASEKAELASIEERLVALVGAPHVVRENPFVIELDDPGPIRSLARYLSALAVTRARKGDLEGAIRAIDAVFWLGTTTAASGVVIDYLSGEAIVRRAVRDTATIAREGVGIRQEEILRVVERHRRRDAALLTIEMERYHVWAQLCPLYSDDGDGDGRIIASEGSRSFLGRLKNLRAGRFPRKAEVFGLINDYYDDLLAAAHAPAGDRLARLRSFARPTMTITSFDIAIVNQTMPTMVLFDALHEERMVLLKVYIAIEEYRRERGTPPPNLGALTPDFLSAVPSSPFAGAGGIHYELEPVVNGGFWLWGVGVDSVDNRGYAGTGGSGLWPGEDQIFWPENALEYQSRGVLPPGAAYASPVEEHATPADDSVYHGPPAG